MQYDFDKYMERRGTECEKWDGMTEDFGTNDLLAMWVADMDFPAAPEILDAIRAKLDEGALGYPLIPDSLRDAVRAWERDHYGWEFGREAVSWACGVVAGLSFATMGLTKPGDQIIIQTPVYMPFYRTVREAGRIIVENPLVYRNGRYEMNLEEPAQPSLARMEPRGARGARRHRAPQGHDSHRRRNTPGPRLQRREAHLPRLAARNGQARPHLHSA